MGVQRSLVDVLYDGDCDLIYPSEVLHPCHLVHADEPQDVWAKDSDLDDQVLVGDALELWDELSGRVDCFLKINRSCS